jgi:hypothetical protein
LCQAGWDKSLTILGENMKRTLAAGITAIMAGTSIWLASGPADARPNPPKQPVNDSATVKVLPRWTYQGNGKLAVTASCSQRLDSAVVTSKILTYPINLPHGGNLLINVTNKTKPGKYEITLWCVPKNGRVDALGIMSVRIMKRLLPFKQPRTPALPRHFKANATVSSGSPAVKKTSNGKNSHIKNKPCTCMLGKKHRAKKVPVPVVAVPTLSPSAGEQQAS